MPQGDERFLALLNQHGTIYQHNNPTRMAMFDISNIPGMGGSMGTMLSMALQPILMQMSQSMGYPALQFGGTQNLADRLWAQDFFLEGRKAISEAAAQDANTYYRQLIGISRLTGTRVGAEQRQAARTMADDLSRMGVILGDIAPDAFDAMHGARGSAAIMARRFHLGGRYAIDPLTGEQGLRGETAGLLSRRVYSELFGPGTDITDMMGFGAGRVGQMYDELTRRGFMGGGPTGRTDAIRRAFGAGINTDVGTIARSLVNDPGSNVGLTPERFREMENNAAGSGIQKVLESQTVRDKVVQFEAERVSSRLKNLVGAVSAMRDIFGDMGKTDAPMVELINGLQALTQGGLATMDPGRLEMTIRRTQALSRMAGISMEGIGQMLSRGAGLAGQMGLDPQFAIGAMQGALAFGTAFVTTGPGVPGWKMPSRDEATALDQSLRLSAAKSDVANQINATLRIADEMKLALDPKSEFAAMAKAMREGRFEYEHPRTGVMMPVVKDYQTWLRLATDAGIDPSQAFLIRTHTVAGQEYGVKYNTQDLVRLTQRDVSVNPLLQEVGAAALQRLGVGGEGAAALTQRAIEVMWGADAYGRPIPGGMTAAEAANPAQRNRVFVRELSALAAKRGMRLSNSEIEQAIVTMWSAWENEPNIVALGGMNTVRAVNDPRTLARATQDRAIIEDRAELARALGGIGRVGVLRRFVDMVGSARGNEGVMESLIEVLGGGVKSPEYAQALNEFLATRKEFDAAPGGAQKEELGRRLQDLTKRLQATGGPVGVLGASMRRLGDLYKRDSDLSARIDELARQEASATDGQKRAEFTRERNQLITERTAIRGQLQGLSREAMQQSEALNLAQTLLGPNANMTDAVNFLTETGAEKAEQIWPMLRMFQGKGVQQLLKDVTTKATAAKQDTERKLTLAGPIQITGSVTLKGDQLVYTDVQTGNHRNPLEDQQQSPVV